MLAHVADLEMEVRFALRGFEVAEIAGHQVVEADDLEAVGEQAIDQMRSEETRRARDERRLSRRAEPHAFGVTRGEVIA